MGKIEGKMHNGGWIAVLNRFIRLAFNEKLTRRR